MAWSEYPATFQNIHNLTAPLIEFAEPEESNKAAPMNKTPRLKTPAPLPPKRRQKKTKHIKTKERKITKKKKKTAPSNDLTLDNFV